MTHTKQQFNAWEKFLTSAEVKSAFIRYYTNAMSGEELIKVLKAAPVSESEKDSYCEYLEESSLPLNEFRFTYPPTGSGSFLAGFYDTEVFYEQGFESTLIRNAFSEIIQQIKKQF
jgi:hypothetical protein